MMRTAMAVVFVLATSLVAEAAVVTVDCNGGGDYTDLPDAVAAAGPGDTVLVAPCVYEVANIPLPPPFHTYPIPLSYESPRIVGSAGAAVTILEGNGGVSAFLLSDTDNTVDVHGLTIRNVDWPFEPPEATPPGGAWMISDCVFEDNGHGIVAGYGGGAIERNTVLNAGDTGIYFEYYYGTIADNEVALCGDRGISGIGSQYGDVTRILRNFVHDNASHGISLAMMGQANGNIIEGNGGNGLQVSPVSSSSYQLNTIRWNANGFVTSGDLAMPSLYHNDIYGNTGYDASVDEWCRTGDLDATENWWGTTDPALIAAKIHDGNDDPAVETFIIFDPWCEAPGCEPASTTVPESWGSIKALYR